MAAVTFFWSYCCLPVITIAQCVYCIYDCTSLWVPEFDLNSQCTPKFNRPPDKSVPGQL